MDTLLDSPLFNQLGRALDAASYRHTLIADNIANVETPGYRRKDIPFQDALRATLSTESESNANHLAMTHPNHLQSEDATPSQFSKSVIHPASPEKANHNNVSIEREMAAMAANTVAYDTLITMMGKKMNQIKSVISGRSF